MLKTPAILSAALLAACLPTAALAQHHGAHHQSGEGSHAMPYHDAEERAEVLGVVEAFMAGLGARDGDAMRALVTEPGFLAMVEARDGGDRTALRDMAGVIEALSSIPVPVEEPIYDPHVMSDGLVAMVWAPFDFFANGAFSHCGVNVFTLMKIDGDWKIATVTYSHIEEGCPERS